MDGKMRFALQDAEDVTAGLRDAMASKRVYVPLLADCNSRARPGRPTIASSRRNIEGGAVERQAAKLR